MQIEDNIGPEGFQFTAFKDGRSSFLIIIFWVVPSHSDQTVSYKSGQKCFCNIKGYERHDGNKKCLFKRYLKYKLHIKITWKIYNEYPGEKPLYHFDFYRLSDESELQEIGWNEYLNRNALVVAEWGERVKTQLPRRYYLIEFDVTGESEREITISLEERADDWV